MISQFLHALLTIALIGISFTAVAKEDEQHSPKHTTTVVDRNLAKVYKIASEVGHPETMQAILLQETGGGTSHPIGNRNSPIGKRSYGLMQVQLIAGRSVLERNPSLVSKYFPGRQYSSILDEEVISLLLSNDEANIRIASTHFKLYLALCKGDWHKAVAAYNAGIGGVRKIVNPAGFKYVVEVKAKIESKVKPFNRTRGFEPKLS